MPPRAPSTHLPEVETLNDHLSTAPASWHRTLLVSVWLLRSTLGLLHKTPPSCLTCVAALLTYHLINPSVTVNILQISFIFLHARPKNLTPSKASTVYALSLVAFVLASTAAIGQVELPQLAPVNLEGFDGSCAQPAVLAFAATERLQSTFLAGTTWFFRIVMAFLSSLVAFVSGCLIVQDTHELGEFGANVNQLTRWETWKKFYEVIFTRQDTQASHQTTPESRPTSPSYHSMSSRASPATPPLARLSSGSATQFSPQAVI